MRAGWQVVVMVCAWMIAGCGAGVMPAIRSEQQRLDVARRMIAERQYAQATDLLTTYVSNNAGSADVDEAIYLLGETHLKTRDWAAAQLEFERLQRDYPESDSSAAASFGLGEAFYGQARGPDFDQEYTRKALEQWESYRVNHPGHWLQPEAGRRIAATRERLAAKLVHNGALYLRLKLGDPARVYYQQVLVEFPDTPQAGEATIGLALADALAGRKPQAIESLKRIESEFSGQPIAARAAKERARLER